MATNQTAVVNENNILVESGKIEYSKDGMSTWVNQGLADSVGITFSSTPRDVQPGNGAVPDIAKGSAAQSVNMTAELWELSAQNYVDLTGGLFELTTVAGAPITGQEDVLAANTTVASKFYPFDVQMATGAVVTSIVIVDTANTYVLDTDYRILQVGDAWGYMFISGGDYNATLVITVEYSVTPALSETVTVGGSSTQSSVAIRVTQLIVRTDVAYDIMNRWIIYNCFLEGDLATILKNKDETDAVARIPVTIKGELDATRDLKDQLYSFTRTQVPH